MGAGSALPRSGFKPKTGTRQPLRGQVYPLHGLHDSAQRIMSRISNVPLYRNLFGDSSYIVHYLKALGYDLGEVVQTGSSFGPGVAHESRVSVAGRNFVGNNITFPIGARVGEYCLPGTKVMVPIDGPVRAA